MRERCVSSAFAKRVGNLISQRLQEIGERRLGLGLDKGLRRHARLEFVWGKLGKFLGRNGQPYNINWWRILIGPAGISGNLRDYC